MRVRQVRALAVLGALVACLGLPSVAAAAGPPPPKPIVLGSGWEITDTPTDPTQVGAAGAWRPAAVPGVFDSDAALKLWPGTVKQYRLRFMAPAERSFSWALRFEQVRRAASVYLNGKLIGGSLDPYSPFEVPAAGLVPGQLNELVVTVDNRRSKGLVEGWWNWGGIVRPVSLVPRGKATLGSLGLLSDVSCKGQATSCKASVLIDGVLSKLPRESRMRGRGQPQPELNLKLRAPGGRITRTRLPLSGSRAGRRRISLSVGVSRPQLWSPERPALYDATVVLSYRGRTQQVERMRIGLRSVKVKRGFLYLNNRRIQLRGASMHEDVPGRGPALTAADMDAEVRALKEVGANLTRAHYALSEGLLSRLDRAGIMVWNQAPVWQRDFGANLLFDPKDRAYAVRQVAGTVKAARNHPSVITHSVSNELAFEPDRKSATRTFLREAADAAEDLDPTLPLAVDIKTRLGYPEQFTFGRFDVIGINQYFGWYPHVPDFNLLAPFLQEMRDHYPDHALVMTEFGAEGRPDMANSPPSDKGSYDFQTAHVDRTLDVVEALPFMSGAIHWTLREFEMTPGWRGGALPGPGRNTRHHKGVLTYDGERKPAWFVLRDHFQKAPLYP
ncbi:MAG: glycoside hydrolase family 2 TIM barrel-domain containing protein [Thermoleophilaceae bacterium]